MIAISRTRWERPTQQEVADLIARHQSGDSKATDELVSRCRRFLSYCIWKALGSKETGASPINYYMGEAAISLLRHADSFSVDGQSKFTTDRKSTRLNSSH